MQQHFDRFRAESRQMVSTTRRIEARPAGGDTVGMELLVDKLDEPVNPTHHAFGQLAQLAKAPAYYLRTLPSPIAADCFNYGLRFKREIDDVGLLTHHNGSHTLRAATGPNYGRIWNADVEWKASRPVRQMFNKLDLVDILDAATSWRSLGALIVDFNDPNEGHFVDRARDCDGVASSGERILLHAVCYVADFAWLAEWIAREWTSCNACWRCAPRRKPPLASAPSMTRWRRLRRRWSRSGPMP